MEECNQRPHQLYCQKTSILIAVTQPSIVEHHAQIPLCGGMRSERTDSCTLDQVLCRQQYRPTSDTDQQDREGNFRGTRLSQPFLLRPFCQGASWLLALGISREIQLMK